MHDRSPDVGASGEERELVRRVLRGDREAYRLIVLRHQASLAELVFRQTGDRAGTDDMVQETFLRAYKALDRFDPRFRLSTWLARIAINVARDQGRRARVREDGLLRVAPRGGGEPSPLEAAARSEAQVQVDLALRNLPEAQREVVVLATFGGLTQREIAEALALPLGTVKTRHRTALLRLRELVAPLGPGGAP
ncbi:MAG: sigma-70 family RNA polymerase sigma factor [Planctomycetes bacterium]|nr:sigma-70 family RNA polymerase sigma factor [Planctomycetota bacterium]